jgi:AraC-like DNA-binding protein
MAILIRTRDVPPAQRHDAWRSVVCDTLGPLDFRCDPDTPLRGEIAAGELGPVSVGRVKTSTPHSVSRTPGLIRRESPELYRVALTMSGHACLRQDGRAARLGPGQFTIYDFTRPYELAYDSGVQLAVFSFPREMLALPLDLVAGLTAVPVIADGGAGALAAPLLRRVTLDLDSYPPSSAARLSTVVMSLVTTTIAEQASQAGSLPAESREQTLLLRIHAFIEQHLGDADLAPGLVAAAHYISVRYLYRLFEAQGTTVAAWIRHRRLERCRADLADPAWRTAPVSAVAARWGLPDSAHFSRLFRRTYGLPPAEYRRARLAPGPDAGCAGNVNRLAAAGNAAAVLAAQTGTVCG